MPDEQKMIISRLRSENAMLKEIIKNLYKKTLEALNFINLGDIDAIEQAITDDKSRANKKADGRK